MIAKLFEIRDKATFIPALALALSKRPDLSDAENYLLGRSGYGGDRCVMLSRLNGGHIHCDPYNWGDRTMHAAHLFIEENFDNLESGAVIDVEFILGETKAPKVSEAIA